MGGVHARCTHEGVRRAVHEVVAAAAVCVDVEEAGDDRPARQVAHVRDGIEPVREAPVARRLQHAGDAAVRKAQGRVLEDAVREYDAGVAQDPSVVRNGATSFPI